MGRLQGEEDWLPAGGFLHPIRAPRPPWPRTLPTSLEVMLSRSLVSSTFHSSARIACSICSCSEDLGAEPVSPGALSLLCHGTPPPFPLFPVLTCQAQHWEAAETPGQPWPSTR